MVQLMVQFILLEQMSFTPENGCSLLKLLLRVYLMCYVQVIQIVQMILYIKKRHSHTLEV